MKSVQFTLFVPEMLMFVPFKNIRCLTTLLVLAAIGLSASISQVHGQAKTETKTESEVKTVSEAESATDEEPKVDAKTKALYEKLSKYLSGTKWTGTFTVEGKDEPQTEHYEILSATKNEVGDYWNLVARIKYGGHDQTLTLPPIPIKFAGGTPVITIDNVRFPGFGAFDARVLIRGGKYAGTWRHSGGAGGHLFGKIERMDADEVKEKADKVKQAEAAKKEEKVESEDK